MSHICWLFKHSFTHWFFQQERDREKAAQKLRPQYVWASASVNAERETENEILFDNYVMQCSSM